MATTPNYGWVTPAPTDFVTDLPADFETFADAVDADLAGLLGGTTGQVLTKDSATDHDFSWQTPAVSTPNGYVLFSTTTLTGANSITVSGISDKASLLILVETASTNQASDSIEIYLNNASTGYSVRGMIHGASSNDQYSGSAKIPVSEQSNNAASTTNAAIWVDGANSADPKTFTAMGMASAGGGSGQKGFTVGGVFTGGAITSVVIKSGEGGGGNFDAGTMKIYAKAI